MKWSPLVSAFAASSSRLLVTKYPVSKTEVDETSSFANEDSTCVVAVSGVPVHRAPLRRNDPRSPWCYVATVGAPSETTRESLLASSPPAFNFLAAQVWPAARAAADAIEERLGDGDDDHVAPVVVCELGCGPGLPSLTAACATCAEVVATDLDPFALRLVDAAAEAQGLLPSSSPTTTRRRPRGRSRVSTRIFDLTDEDAPLPEADLYVMADVFESSRVALGAATHAHRAVRAGKEVWVFAQFDRADREVFAQRMRDLSDDDALAWSPSFDDRHCDGKLWLCDVDETKVRYN